MIIIPPIPPGATHLEYCNSKASIVATIDAIGDFTGLKGGRLRFGKYLAGSDRFESLMPGDQGETPKEFAALVPLPVPIQRDQHRTMRDLEPVRPPEGEKMPAKAEKAAKAQYSEAGKASPAMPKLPPGLSAAPKPPKEPKAPKPPQGEGRGAKVWAVADALLIKLGRAPYPAEALAALPPDFKEGMVTTQLWAWRKSKGVQPPPRIPKSN